MKRTAAVLCLVVVSALAGVASAATGSGTFAITPASVVAGSDLTLSFCGFAAGEGGYYTVNGPSVSGTRFWGPANGVDCVTYTESTSGWNAGKYKFIAYVTTSTGRSSRVGSIVVTVSAP